MMMRNARVRGTKRHAREKEALRPLSVGTHGTSFSHQEDDFKDGVLSATLPESPRPTSRARAKSDSDESALGIVARAKHPPTTPRGGGVRHRRSSDRLQCAAADNRLRLKLQQQPGGATDSVTPPRMNAAIVEDLNYGAFSTSSSPFCSPARGDDSQIGTPLSPDAAHHTGLLRVASTATLIGYNSAGSSGKSPRRHGSAVFAADFMPGRRLSENRVASSGEYPSASERDLAVEGSGCTGQNEATDERFPPQLLGRDGSNLSEGPLPPLREAMFFKYIDRLLDDACEALLKRRRQEHRSPSPPACSSDEDRPFGLPRSNHALHPDLPDSDDEAECQDRDLNGGSDDNEVDAFKDDSGVVRHSILGRSVTAPSQLPAPSTASVVLPIASTASWEHIGPGGCEVPPEVLKSLHSLSTKAGPFPSLSAPGHSSLSATLLPTSAVVSSLSAHDIPQLLRSMTSPPAAHADPRASEAPKLASVSASSPPPTPSSAHYGGEASSTPVRGLVF